MQLELECSLTNNTRSRPVKLLVNQQETAPFILFSKKLIREDAICGDHAEVGLLMVVWIIMVS